MAVGVPEKIRDPKQKRLALDFLVDKLIPGRRQDLRENTRQELTATSILRMPLTDVSAKIRTGPPDDFDKDMELPVWAGVLPLAQVWGEPEPDPALPDGTPVPDYVRNYNRRPAS